MSKKFWPNLYSNLLYKLGLGHVVSGNKITGKTPGISFDLDKAMKIKNHVLYSFQKQTAKNYIILLSL